MKKGIIKDNAGLLLLLAALMTIVGGTMTAMYAVLTSDAAKQLLLETTIEEKQDEVESDTAGTLTRVGHDQSGPVLNPSVDKRTCYLTLGYGDKLPTIQPHNSYRLRFDECQAVLIAIEELRAM